MSGASSRPAEWWSGLEPVPASLIFVRGDGDDPRLGDIAQRWDGDHPTLRAGEPVVIGFPCEEGVRRNGGRPGAATAPDSIRHFLYRLTTWDGVTGIDLAGSGLLDLGNVRVTPDLEASQRQLGEVVAAVLRAEAIPIVLGGGHETAFGHFLGYVAAGMDAAIINVDAHLDVRPFPNGGHSGSPFRQAIEHAERPLKSGSYRVIGAQRQSVARTHAEYVERHGGRIHWLPPFASPDWALPILADELDRMEAACSDVLLSIDADAFRQAGVPGTSAPSAIGLDAAAWPEIAFRAGARASVRSLELVEVNPTFDRDGQTARWAALGLRQFLVGLATRSRDEGRARSK
jgi:formiminoglutamase